MIHFENENFMNILKKPLKTHGFREVAWNFNINTASTIENVLWISVEGFQRSRANKSKMEIKLNVKFKRSTNPSREKYCIVFVFTNLFFSNDYHGSSPSPKQ